MLFKVGSIFLALVFIFFVLLYPDKLVDIVEAFISTARRMAVALGEMSPGSG